jgi:hypothetical protein
MGVWRIIGPNSHWEVLFPLLCGFCSVLYLLLIAARKRIEQKSEIKERPSPTTRSASPFWKRRKREGGAIPYREIAFSTIVMLSLLVLAKRMSNAPHVTLYGLRVQEVLSDDSIKFIAPSTGLFRADFCPENHFKKYEPRVGYVICRLIYTDMGCMDVNPASGNKITWVKDSLGKWTVPLSDTDTFKPYPYCTKDEPKEEISDAR